MMVQNNFRRQAFVSLDAFLKEKRESIYIQDNDKKEPYFQLILVQQQGNSEQGNDCTMLRF